MRSSLSNSKMVSKFVLALCVLTVALTLVSVVYSAGSSAGSSNKQCEWSKECVKTGYTVKGYVHCVEIILNKKMTVQKKIISETGSTVIVEIQKDRLTPSTTDHHITFCCPLSIANLPEDYDEHKSCKILICQ